MASGKQPDLPGRSRSASARLPSVMERPSPLYNPVDSPIQRQSSTSSNHGLYTVNSLSSYSFGSVQPAHESLPQINPLSQEEDHNPRCVDITPRPSVVEYGASGRIRANPSFPLDPVELDHRLVSPDPARARSSDAASHRTFGTSSASASVTSFSSVGHHNSRMSEHSTSTRHTSAVNTDDEDERSNLDLSSEDEYDDYYDQVNDDDPAYGVEISSTVYEESGFGESPSFGWVNYGGASRTDLSYDRRRGSLPMAIPGVLDGRNEERGRDREDSLITLRRPSRSLDDDLSILNLHSTSTSLGSGIGVGTTTDPLAHSVPGSDSDWRSIANKQRISSQRGSVSTASTVKDTRYPSITPTAVPHPTNQTVNDDFDPAWLEMMRGGIISVPTSDFVMQGQEPHSKSLLNGLRRPSVASSIMTFDDSFLRAVGRWDSQGYGVQRREWTFKRETADGSGPHTKSASSGYKLAGLLGSKLPSERDRVGLSSISNNKSVSAEEKEKREREKEKERRLPENWKGMAIGAGEVWGNTLIGRYQVNRTTSTPSDPQKGPQQRLSIIHFSDDWTKLMHKSPPVTVHKHSKAIAYSISRFYRWRSHEPKDENHHFKPTASRDTTYSRPPPSRDGSVVTTKTSATYTRSKGSTTMILLAPRRVQEDYTNTTTTRKLESHGLLDEQGRTVRDKGQKEDRERDKRRKGEQSKKTKKEKGEHDEMSSSGSVVSTSSSLAPTPAALLAQDFTAERQRVRRRRSFDSSSDEEPVPHRTPHSETYSTVDPGAIDQLRPNRSYPASEGPSLIERMLRGNKIRTPPASGNYNPPWMVMSSRNEQEEQQRMVKNLSSSFAGVGLLPPTHKEKSRSASQKQKHKDRIPAKDIFDEMDADTLFMILPMWPGETDPKSRNKAYLRPDIPLQDRLFLILSYRTNPKQQKTQKDGKKVRSPTSSGDAREDRSILLSAFYISARIVRYRELMGSGMRVPDEGLAVSGPLEEAYLSIPRHESAMQVIGNCSSRESGIEFDPEGLKCLDLCRPSPLAPEMPDSGPIPIPTPIGRAVMEIAFIGGMALTSFGSITSS